ncbi:MAG: OmpA family protein, partial [Pseudomonadota bacterium]
VEEPAVEEAPVDEAVTEEPAVEEAPADEAVTEEPLVEEAPADEAVTEEPADEAATELATEAEAEVAVDPVDVPEPSEEAVETLTTLLEQPDAVDPETLDAAAALVEVEEGAPVKIDTAENADDVVIQEITEADTRSSGEEFRAAPTVDKAKKKKDRLSDLEKVGLVALGALVVGAIINSNNDEVVQNTGDRVVVRRGDGDYVVYKDDDTLLRRPGSTVRTETFRDGSTRTIVQRNDGTQVVTIRDATGRVLRRATYDDRGREIVLIDDFVQEEYVDVTTLPRPTQRVRISTSDDDALLKARMAAADAEDLGRSFSLRQIREIQQVRALAATIDIDNITFDSGSSAITATEAEELADLGRFITEMVADNPAEMFLIEGHTDAVGSAASNLALSDRRAESVALALTEYFDVPPENLVVQGYGESELLVDTQGDERTNRRVAIRVITPLLQTASR